VKDAMKVKLTRVRGPGYFRNRERFVEMVGDEPQRALDFRAMGGDTSHGCVLSPPAGYVKCRDVRAGFIGLGPAPRRGLAAPAHPFASEGVENRPR
jgi:hypothetical protein